MAYEQVSGTSGLAGQLTPAQDVMFYVPQLRTAGCSCLSRYLAYKFLGTVWVNMLLTLYLTGVGLLALGETTFAVAVSSMDTMWIRSSCYMHTFFLCLCCMHDPWPLPRIVRSSCSLRSSHMSVYSPHLTSGLSLVRSLVYCLLSSRLY